ncbi:MAG: PAS domain S-box protein [Gemmatimonadales bacterium]|jgi:hypothetical protein
MTEGSERHGWLGDEERRGPRALHALLLGVVGGAAAVSLILLVAATGPEQALFPHTAVVAALAAVVATVAGVLLYRSARHPLLRRSAPDKAIPADAAERYRDLAEESLVGVYLIQDGLFRYVNPRLAQIFGYTVDELVDRCGPLDLTMPEDRQRVTENMRRRLEGEVDSIHYGFKGRKKDGTPFDVDVYGSRTQHAGRPAVVGSLLDVTERKRAERLLRESEEETRRLLATLPDMLIRIRADGRVAQHEGRLGRPSYLTHAEFFRQRFRAPLAARIGTVVMRDARAALRSGTASVQEYQLAADGEDVAYDCRFIPLGDQEVLVVIRDVTDRMLALADAERSSRWYQTLAQSAPVGIWHAEPDGAGRYINPKLGEITGLTAESARGPGWADALHPDDRARVVGEWTAYTRGEAPYHSTYRFRHHDGTVRWAVGKAQPICGPEGEVLGHVGTLTDVTELVAHQEALSRLSRDERSAREAERSSLARELHDELGQLLTSLGLDLDCIAAELPGGGRRLQRQLTQARAAADRCIETVQRIAAELRPPMLDDLGLTGAIEWLGSSIAERGELRCDVDIDVGAFELEPPVAIAVYRIVQESLTNAIRHARATRVDVRLRALEGTLVLQIEDDGVGILDERASDPDSLGLLGMRERALGIGASIDIHRRLEGGTRIELRLPLGGTWKEAGEATTRGDAAT